MRWFHDVCSSFLSALLATSCAYGICEFESTNWQRGMYSGVVESWTNAASALLRSSAFGDVYSVSQKASKVRSSASPIAECGGVHDYGAVQV